jgi:hypothetical protein
MTTTPLEPAVALVTEWTPDYTTPERESIYPGLLVRGGVWASPSSTCSRTRPSRRPAPERGVNTECPSASRSAGRALPSVSGGHVAFG